MAVVGGEGRRGRRKTSLSGDAKEEVHVTRRDSFPRSLREGREGRLAGLSGDAKEVLATRRDSFPRSPRESQEGREVEACWLGLF